MKEIYLSKERCSGCAACKASCPNGCISMQEDEEGFLYPIIKKEACIECGICKSVCPWQKKYKRVNEKSIQTYYAYSSTKNNCINSASGGVFFEMAKKIVDDGGSVFGAAFDSAFEVFHTECNDTIQLKKIIGTKYVQSKIGNAYEVAKKRLEEGRVVLFSGTPCQIEGLLQYLGNDYENLYTVSIICYGVPSPMIWRKYLSYILGRFESSGIREVNFRKNLGDGVNACLEIKMGEGIYCETREEDLYYRGLFENLFLRPSCHKCKMKERLVGDIILGDAWGASEDFVMNKYGANTILEMTSKGAELLKIIKEKLYIKEWSWNRVQQFNPMLLESTPVNKKRKFFFGDIEQSGDLFFSLNRNIEKTEKRKMEVRSLQVYPIMLEYIKKRGKGWSIVSEIEKRYGLSSWILYGITEWIELIVDELQLTSNTCIDIYSLADKNYQKYKEGVLGFVVCSFDETIEAYRVNKINKILICSFIHKSEIADELKEKGVDYNDIVCLNEIIGR